MNDLTQRDALTDEQRERIAQNVTQAIAYMSGMGQEAAALLVRWAEETLPIIQGLCAALLRMQADLEQSKGQGDEPARVYPGFHGDGRALRAPKHAGLRDNRR